jgi:hypothetical protein
MEGLGTWRGSEVVKGLLKESRSPRRLFFEVVGK